MKRIKMDPTTAWLLAIFFACVIIGVIYSVLSKIAEQDEPYLQIDLDKSLTDQASTESETSASVPAEDPNLFQIAQPNKEQDYAKWAYHGETGVESWARLDDAYQKCETGKSQSPIDIIKATKDRRLGQIDFHYQPQTLSLVNQHHSLAAYPKGKSYVVFDLDTYTLRELWIHLPSEHTVKGLPYDIELQLVHKGEQGTLIIALFLQEGSETHPNIEHLWATIPTQRDGRKEEKILINLADILPKSKAYWHYLGSETKPPCKEGVKWVVLQEPVAISNRQVDAVIEVIKGNARPTQAMSGRKVLSFE